MPLVLYSFDGSPPCRSVLMVIEYLGLKVEVKELNSLAGEQFKPEYLAKNHLHTIPLLEDGDFYLPDSHAIITYLVSKYGTDNRATLYPADLRTRAQVDQRLFLDTGTLFPKIRLVIEHLIKNKATEIPEDYKKQVEECYSFIEKFLEKTPFLVTDHVTLADIAVIATVSSLNAFYPIDEKFVKIHDWWNRLKQYDWYLKGNAKGLAMIEGFAKETLKL